MSSDPVSEPEIKGVIGNYLRKHWPVSDSQKLRILPKKTPKPVPGLQLIRTVPWLLLVGFLFSFFWDFEGISLLLDESGVYLYSQGERAFALIRYAGLDLLLFRRVLELDGLIVTISAAGLIGFFTNWLAVTMLFHPRQSRPLLGHGLIPASRDRVADLIALAISRDLLSEEIILERIHQSGIVSKYRQMVLQVTEDLFSDANFQQEMNSLIRDFLKEKFSDPELKDKMVTLVMEMLDSAAKKGVMGVAVKMYQILNRDGLRRQIEQVINDLPETVDLIMEELSRVIQTLPKKITERSDDIEQWLTRAIISFVGKIDIYEIVSKNLRDYDDLRFEELIKRATNDQLVYIKYLGGALGAIGGLVIFDQWLALPILAIILGSVIILDYLIVWIAERRSSA